ncbi:MAG: hypothetical protein HY863_08625 [Chloroflexi bacterium]|nr:hypothetical protein [Chloroflexota bacterium]
MNSIINALRHRKKPIILMAEKWRWVWILVFGLFVFGLEAYEFFELKFNFQPLHLIELALYCVLFISTGLYLELFARANRGNEKLLRILEYKHNLSLELLVNDDLESLITKLVELPGKITDVGEAYLLFRNPINGQFDVAGYWKNPLPDVAGEWEPVIPCRKCLEKTAHTYNFHLCHNDGNSVPDIYSLGIANTNYPTTVIRFRIRSGAKLRHEEEKIFNSIGDEIAVALRASQDRKRLLDMQAAEVAMAERRMVFGYVHDQLGQNLGYLQLKLDQLGTNDNISELKPIRNDLKQLREVANQSYEIVRDILKKMQSESIPNLSNLLKEHARVVSERAKFSLDFNSIGQPVKLLPETQQIIFFAFGEVLNNIEKHSKANRVDVLLTWNEGFLDISVADNGIGFESDSIQKDEHFGLEIMNERISYFNGKVMIDSAADTGTVVSITIPTQPMKRIPL